MRSFLAVVALIMAYTQVYAQHGISTVFAPSKVIKHRSTLLFDVPKRTSEFRIAYTYQTGGLKGWEKYWNKPQITINAVFVDFGDAEVLGSAIGFLPEMHFALYRRGRLKTTLQFGTGIAYLNRPYDAIDNPSNNAIGSFLNNMTSLKFGVAYSMRDNFSASLSTGMVHFSNGLSSSPNAGINIYGLNLGLQYQFVNNAADKRSTTTLDGEIKEEKYRKWTLDFQYNYGFTEVIVPGGPKYIVDAISIGLAYRYRPWLIAYVGAEYEYNDAIYTRFKFNFHTEEESYRKARSHIVYLGHELRFGPVFNRINLGFYMPWPEAKDNSWYTKVLTGIYLPKVGNRIEPYVGVLLKTHSAVADYLALVVGLRV